MFKIFGTIVLSTLWASCHRGAADPRRDEAALNFNQGQRLQDNDMRQIVGILYDGKPLCTGTILNSRLIVTAGHCLAHRDAKKFSIFMGAFPDHTTASTPLSGVASPESVMVSRHYGVAEGDKLAHGDIGLMKFRNNLPVPSALQMAFAPFFIKPLDFKEFQKLITPKALVYGIGYGLSSGSGTWAKTVAPMRVVGVEPHRSMLLLAGTNTAGPGDSGAAIVVKVNESGHFTPDNLRLVGVLSAAVYAEVPVEDRVYRGPALVTPITGYLGELDITSTLSSKAPDTEVPPLADFSSWLSRDPKLDDYACGSEPHVKSLGSKLRLPRAVPCHLPLCSALPPRGAPSVMR